MIRLSLLMLGIVLALFSSAQAQAPELYVPNYDDGDVSVVDPTSLATLARIPVTSYPRRPEAVAFSPDGKYAFISIARDDKVAVIDTDARTVIKRIQIHPRSDPLIYLRPGGDRIYVTDCDRSGIISVIDVASQEAVDVNPATPELDGITVAGSTWPMAFTPDGRTAYAGNCSRPPGIHRIDLTTNTVVGFIPTSDFVNGLEISPAGDVALATGGGRVLVIDLASGAEVGAVMCGPSPCVFGMSQGVEFNGDGSRAYIVGYYWNTFTTLDMTSPLSPAVLSQIVVATARTHLWELEILGARAHLIAFGYPSEVVTLDISTDTPTQIARAAVGNGAFEIGVRRPLELSVTIDIKPGSFPNSINLRSGGTVPAAIFSTTSFDARTVDPTTVTLAGAQVALKGKGTLMASVEDVNGDGLLDLVVHVRTEALQLSETDTEAVLEGTTFDGAPIRGTDSVRVVP